MALHLKGSAPTMPNQVDVQVLMTMGLAHRGISGMMNDTCERKHPTWMDPQCRRGQFYMVSMCRFGVLLHEVSRHSVAIFKQKLSLTSSDIVPPPGIEICDHKKNPNPEFCQPPESQGNPLCTKQLAFIFIDGFTVCPLLSQ